MERSGTGPRARRIFPAEQTADGALCIEIRIKQYHDGTMTKLLENLANVRFGLEAIVVEKGLKLNECVFGTCSCRVWVLCYICFSFFVVGM